MSVIAFVSYHESSTYELLNAENAPGIVSRIENGAVSTVLDLDISPNPFSGSGAIRYSVVETGLVRLSITNMLGKEVAMLLDEYNITGLYEYRLTGLSLPSGMYLVQFQNGKHRVVKNLCVLR